MGLTESQLLKFKLFECGLNITRRARDLLADQSSSGALSSNDFASTSGVILRLEDNVWVNSPIREYNPNFVGDSPFTLDLNGDELCIRGGGLFSSVSFWLPPEYHNSRGRNGRPYTDWVVTHGDRARLSPMDGCSMVCTFCDVPYGNKYGKKKIDHMIEAVRAAVKDPVQPAKHLLISGGTPRTEDIEWLKDVYRTMLASFPEIGIDIMMVPKENLIDVDELGHLGVDQLSINLELYSDEIASKLMPRKHDQTRRHYLDFIENGASRLGPGRVRSMLMVGLEPPEETLAGVKAIAERGGVPVLSPFRPDPSTPLRNRKPPDSDLMLDVFLRASEIASKLGSDLGPSCVPCSHNTISLPPLKSEGALLGADHPRMLQSAGIRECLAAF